MPGIDREDHCGQEAGCGGLSGGHIGPRLFSRLSTGATGPNPLGQVATPPENPSTKFQRSRVLTGSRQSIPGCGTDSAQTRRLQPPDE